MDAGHRRTYSGSEGGYQWVEASRSASTMFRKPAPFGGGANRNAICTGDKTMTCASTRSGNARASSGGGKIIKDDFTRGLNKGGLPDRDEIIIR